MVRKYHITSIHVEFRSGLKFPGLSPVSSLSWCPLSAIFCLPQNITVFRMDFRILQFLGAWSDHEANFEASLIT